MEHAKAESDRDRLVLLHQLARGVVDDAAVGTNVVAEEETNDDDARAPGVGTRALDSAFGGSGGIIATTVVASSASADRGVGAHWRCTRRAGP